MSPVMDHVVRPSSLKLNLTCFVLVILTSFTLARPKTTDLPQRTIPDKKHPCLKSCIAHPNEKAPPQEFLSAYTPEKSSYFEDESPLSVYFPGPYIRADGGRIVFEPNVTENCIKKNKTCVCTEKNPICDLSYCALKRLPDHLPKQIESLDLSNNCIDTIPDGYFSSFQNLVCLNLESNRLKGLGISSFVGLWNLTCLNLRSNQILMNRTNYPKGVFRDLKKLSVLKINRNNKEPKDTSLEYPHTALSDLGQLAKLYMDGLANKTLGPGFRSMKLLRQLTLAGYLEGICVLNRVTPETFQHVRQIETLNISDCYILGHQLDSHAFTPLENLRVLDLTFNDRIGLGSLVRAMKGMTSCSSLKKLYINAVTSRYSTGLNVTVELAKSLPRSLEKIAAQQNAFESVELGAFEQLPENLSDIDVSDNRFLFGSYLKEISHMKNLKTINLNGAIITYHIPLHYPFPMSLPPNPQSVQGQNVWESFDRPDSNEFVLEFPPNLVHIDMGFAGLKYILSSLTSTNNNSLAELYLRGNHFPSATGPFTGFQNLRVLNLGECGVKDIYATFLNSFPNLRGLYLRNNYLAGQIAGGYEPQIFRSLRNLVVLDMSENRLRDFKKETFSGLLNLRNLSLSSNVFREFDVTIDHMTKLTYLDLSYTQLYSLPQDVRDHIDSLKDQVAVNMSMTPIQCDCDNLDFIRWIVHSCAINATSGYYKCVVPNQYERYITDGYKETLHDLERGCQDNYLLFLLVLAGTLLVFCIVIFGIVFRFRWKLRYYYYLAYLKLKGKEESESSDDFLYDVFLCYANADEAFVVDELQPEITSRGLRVRVRDSDFKDGALIVKKILSAIRESRKTLVVLTMELLRSKWCMYALQMAKMEAIYTGRPVLVFLLKEALTTSDLGVELLYHIRNSRYISYPRADELLTSGARDQMQDVLTTFWDKLTRDLRR